MKTAWILSWICSYCSGPYIGVDGKYFDSIEICRRYANERIKELDLTNSSLEWWCSKTPLPPRGAFEAIEREK